MWIYKLVFGLFVISCSEGRRNALQDYQKTEGVRLLVGSPDSSHLTKSKKVSMAKCARACSRNRRLPFTCRYVCLALASERSSMIIKTGNANGCHSTGTHQESRVNRTSTTNFIKRKTMLGSALWVQVRATGGGEVLNDFERLCSELSLHQMNQRGQCTFVRPLNLLYQTALNVPVDQLSVSTVMGKITEDPWTTQKVERNASVGTWMDHTNTCTTPRETPSKSNVVETTDCYQGRGEGYRGTVDVLPTGLTCQRWDSQYPHNHTFIPEAYPCKDLRENYCRNPDGQELPWCFTTDPRVRTMFCTNIPQCGTRNRLSGDASQNTIPLGELSSVACFVHKKTRIVGGDPVVSDGSWMVSIQKGGTHWCGGSLIRDEWVLTDRQCFSSCVPDLSEYRVWLGVSDIQEGSPDFSMRQEVSITHVICGPEGSSLALIRLSKPALPADNVHTIQLPVDGCSIPEGRLCKMYGWGETKGTGHDDVLKAVDLPIVNNERCREMHRGNLHITNTKICAGGKRNEGVCERDYGGPLVCQDGEIKVIVGVSVHGRGCARANQPGIFINVPFYTQWIYKVFRYYPNPEII
ncbi:Hepatocyte growth factor Hepatopoietin-A [Collichthys lucidus]|uniref:Hepatocyte growth factor Hepatopoietin-A n=1 Tax=Collichthys lucidus TaxID=240159 RepID=A0A4U5UFU7_COLLU|nr:Hepatocyte growth factor Hepatopoietin-A [Collichthys lucidus]